MAAPIPLPTNLKALRGTLQPCRVNEREPKPPKGIVKMPKGLTREEKRHWKSVANDLESAGILTVLDVQALRLYCRVYTQWCDANSKLESFGSVIKGSHGTPMLSPYFKVSRTCMEQMLALLREFGMTPSSRTRIRTEKDEPDNDFEVWQKKRKMAREGV